MSQCQSCGGKADLYLCPKCVTALRDVLEHLPQWITHLQEAAIGQVRLGDGGGGRSTSRREPFKGDDEVLARCACGHAETKHDDYYVAADGNTRSVEQGCTAIDREVIYAEDDAGEDTVLEKPCHCREYRPVANQARMRAQLLAAGRINSRAADRLDKVRNSLTTWTRHLGETRGIVFVRPGFVGPLLPGHVRLANTTPAIVAFLAENVGAIACDESAGECLAELEDHVAAIEKVINRPIPPRFIGPCPTIVDDHRRECGIRLTSRRDAVEVRCPSCRVTHSVQDLNIRLINQTAYLKYKLADIYRILIEAGEDMPSRSSFYEWCKRARKDGALKIRGYERPNGRTVINRHSEADEDLFWVADVRKVITERRAARVRLRDKTTAV